MTKVLVAYAEGDADVGACVAEALADAGVEAVTHEGPPNLKADKDRFDAASAVVLVWSRHAAAEAGLRREALVAAGRGKLVIARAGAAQPPPSLRTARSWPVTRANAVAGARRLARGLAAPPAPPQTGRAPSRTPARAPEKRKGDGAGWIVLMLMALILGGAGWAATTGMFGPNPMATIRALLSPPA